MKRLLFIAIVILHSSILGADKTNLRDKRNWIATGVHTASYGVIALGVGIASSGSGYEDGSTWAGMGVIGIGTAGLIVPTTVISKQRTSVLKYAPKDSRKRKISRISKGLQIGAISTSAFLYPSIFLIHTDYKAQVIGGLSITSGTLLTSSLFVYTIGRQRIGTEESERNNSAEISVSPTVNIKGDIGIQLSLHF